MKIKEELSCPCFVVYNSRINKECFCNLDSENLYCIEKPVCPFRKMLKGSVEAGKESFREHLNILKTKNANLKDYIRNNFKAVIELTQQPEPDAEVKLSRIKMFCAVQLSDWT